MVIGDNCTELAYGCNRFFVEKSWEPYHISCKLMWSPARKAGKTLSAYVNVGALKPGDCVIHYVMQEDIGESSDLKNSVNKRRGGWFVAISKVGKVEEIDYEQFIRRLKSLRCDLHNIPFWLYKLPLSSESTGANPNEVSYLDVWEKKYKKFIDKYKQKNPTLFYIELDKVYWFSQPVELKTIVEKISAVMYRAPIIAAYLNPICTSWAFQILRLGCPSPSVFKDLGKDVNDLIGLAVLASLIAGKSLLLVGPPGSGKTSYIRDLLERLGIDYVLRTGNPEWTAFDVVGGFDLQGKWRDGFITATIRRSLESRRPVWVVIDELNRTNLDLALGEYFTFLDVEHRNKPFKIGDEELKVPYSFRILATMNSFDRSLLQKLGFALRRRFTVVDSIRFRNLSYSEEEVEKFCERIANLPQCELQVLDLERALRIFELSESSDYAVIFSEIYDWFSENRESMLKIQVGCPYITSLIDLGNLLACIIDEVNGKLKGYNCEVCPVEITPGIAADVLRFLVAAKALNSAMSNGVSHSWSPEKLLYFLDFAIATYIIPQLDLLAGYVQVESHNGQAAQIVGEVAKKLKGWGLRASAKLVEKLSQGFNVP
jgi:MoxR-like ATPase